MDFVSIVLVLLSAFTLFHGYRILYTRVKKFPPGPTPLPIIGNLHLLGDQPHKSLAKLAKTHGPLMCLRLGFINTVIISSSAMAKEVLQKQDLAFSSRSAPNAVHACDQPKYSVVWLPVALRWRSLRKVLNSNIFSGSRLDASQHLRSRKVQELIAYCGKSSQAGEAVDVGRAAFRTSLNLLSNTIFSMDLTDPFSDSGKEFKDLVWNIMVEAGKTNLVDYFPFLEKIDPQGIRRRMTIHFGKMIELFNGLINERLEKGKSKDTETNDVLDVLLTTSKENPEEIDRSHIERMCLDLFVAGTDTTSNTLEWAMTEAIRNPETMKKAKSELEEIVGKGKIIGEEDVQRLPYLRCMVKETLRIHPPVPFLIPRKVEEDVEVRGYTVPKNCRVLVNAWAIGRDADAWKNPLEFKPERFLESDIDVRGRDFELIPFGAGRRICPGLPLAIRMVPVMLGSLLNSFDWKLEGGSSPEELDMEEKFGITLQKALPLRAVPIHLNDDIVKPDDISRLITAVDSIKVLGNEWFKKEDYKMAVRKYRKALKYLWIYAGRWKTLTKSESLRKTKFQILTNSSVCKLKSGNLKGALLDTNFAIRDGKDNAKAFYSQGQVYMALNNIESRRHHCGVKQEFAIKKKKIANRIEQERERHSRECFNRD